MCGGRVYGMSGEITDVNADGTYEILIVDKPMFTDTMVVGVSHEVSGVKRSSFMKAY